MHAREDTGICRLARFLAIAILICGTTVSEGQIIISVPDGTYSELAFFDYPKPSAHYYGADLYAPELLEPPIVIRDLEEIGHAYVIGMKAETFGEGPECYAQLRSDAIEPSGGQYGTWTNSSASVLSGTAFDFVVHNKTGTAVEFIVPLIVEGTLFAEASYEEHGTNPLLETKIQAMANIYFYECGGNWTDTPIGWYGLNLYHNHVGEVLPPYVLKRKPWLLTVPIRLGKDPGDRACFSLRSNAYVSGVATAYSNLEHPELNSYSKMAATAVVDPYIYIDPTWEHADKFGIAFPDNVTPLTDPPRLLFFDDFETGDSTVWSSAVQ